MEVSLNEAETRYYRDLFVCCDVEKTGKVPILKATELFRSADLLNDEKKILSEITSLAGIPAAALHISRAQFFSCLKLIAAHQAEIPLRKELIVASNVQLPLPRFSWKQSPSGIEGAPQTNGSLVGVAIQPQPAPPNNAEHRHSLTHAGSRRNSNVQVQQEAAINSDVPSTDSEVEQNESSGGVAEGVGGHESSGREMRRRRAGSPEAWSTNSDSPTPTNSVAERWAKENLWHGLLGDEHRQLLGTEEESSDRHSSDDEETDLETVYQITPEQRDYYYKQFKFVQHDPNGLLSGQVAKDFFEKSRIPVEELRHIWQLCDVTRDGALSLSEFTAAMHLVVLRRNNIPLPTTLPACLHPNVLQHSATTATNAAPPSSLAPAHPQEPPEADLLHLNDDDDEENTENTIVNAVVAITSSSATTTTTNAIAATNNEKNVMNLSTLSTSSQDVPPTQWTKFTESPTSNISSPGPKPVNFDMQRTAQAVVSDPQILHPVPLRVTPVGGASANTTTVATAVAGTTTTTAEPQPHDIGDGLQHNNLRSYSPKQTKQTAPTNSSNTTSMTASHHRDILQQQSSDLRAIQRPQPKKLPNKSVGAIPPPPQREPSVGSSSSGGVISGADTDSANSSINSQHQVTVFSSTVKKDIQPPLPPPRPHRHGRSNSLDLNKFKAGSSGSGQQAENDENAAEQQHSLPPQQHQQQHFENQQKQQQPPPTQQTTGGAAVPPLSRISLQSNQRVSAFEVYRKPNTPRNSQSPPTAGNNASDAQFIAHAAPFGAAGAAAIAGVVLLPNAEVFEKRVSAITETLRHVSFKPDSNMTDILRHLREQNGLLLHLCNDLSDELLTVQARKEELRLKLEAIDLNASTSNNAAPPRTGSSISAPVTANVTGGSGSSGVHSNV